MAIYSVAQVSLGNNAQHMGWCQACCWLLYKSWVAMLDRTLFGTHWTLNTGSWSPLPRPGGVPYRHAVDYSTWRSTASHAHIHPNCWATWGDRCTHHARVVQMAPHPAHCCSRFIRWCVCVCACRCHYSHMYNYMHCRAHHEQAPGIAHLTKRYISYHASHTMYHTGHVCIWHTTQHTIAHADQAMHDHAASCIEWHVDHTHLITADPHV